MQGPSKARLQIAICRSPFHSAAASEFIPHQQQNSVHDLAARCMQEEGRGLRRTESSSKQCARAAKQELSRLLFFKPSSQDTRAKLLDIVGMRFGSPGWRLAPG